MKVKEKLDVFTKIALQEAGEKKKALEDDLKLQFEAECENIRKTAQQEADERIYEEQQRVQQLKNRDIIGALIESKKSLLDLRNQLLDDIFENVLARVANFIETESYVDALVADIKEIRAQYEGELLVKVCLRDIVLKDILESINGVTVTEGEDNIVGGFKARIAGRNIAFDNSFGTRITEAKRNFNKFNISEG